MIFKYIKQKFIFLLILSVPLMQMACSSDSSKKRRVEVDADEIVMDESIQSGIQTARQIFYSLPSPLETAMILKRAGAEYNPELLNPVENISRYTTTRSMALNLGVYSTNLSYATLFDQTQASIKYMTAAKKMAEGLGILNAIDNSIINRLEENINNREVIMDIISETFLNTNSILEENDRVAVGAIVLVGGWLEGLYLATSVVGEFSAADNELVNRIVDQKLSMVTVTKLLEQNIENADVRDILEDIKELNLIYDKVQFSSSRVEVVSTGSSSATLKSKNQVSVSPEVFAELQDKVKEIRNRYIM